MPRFLIERDVTEWTEDDVSAAGLRAKMCAPWFPGLGWVVSYFDRNRSRLFCVYDAASEDDVRAHSRFSGLPATAVTLVEEIHPGDIEGPEAEAITPAPPQTTTG